MSEFKTAWMTGIFVDPGNRSQLLLANIENLRPVRLDKSQDSLLLSITKKGEAQVPLLLAANQKNALASVFFDDPDAWLKSEHQKFSFADVKAYQEGVYEVSLTSADGLQNYALEQFELLGNNVIASFSDNTIGGGSYKISLGSVNTNIAPLQQIHDLEKTYSDRRLSGLLRHGDNQFADSHYVRPTRPGMGHHYYQDPGIPRLYLNNSLSSALPFVDNASAGMQDVLATASIFKNHDKLPGLSLSNPQQLHDLSFTEEGKVVLCVVFSAGDEQLGLSAGTSSILKTNPNNNDATDFYLPPIPNRNQIAKSFTFKGFLGSKGQEPDGLYGANTLWFTAKDDLAGILGQKSEEFSVDMPFDSRNNQSPSMRVASALGMRDFNNAYVATLEVDPRVVFRPKGDHNLQGVGGHKITNLNIGVPTDASGNSALEKNANDKYWINNTLWSEDWDAYYANTYQGFFDVKTDPVTGVIESISPYDKFSDFYKSWWSNNLQEPFENTQTGGINPIDTVSFAFPWTGVGYTFDYWDQVNAGSENPTSQGRGAGEMVLLPNANWTDQEMTDKFGPGVNPWDYKVQNVQTINQFLKDSIKQADAFPGLDVAGGDSVELALNIKRLGMNRNTLYVYECDPITGKIWTGSMKNPLYQQISSQWLDPNSDASLYHQEIVRGSSRSGSGNSKFFDVFKVDASEMPAYKGSIDLGVKLNSTKNWGLLLQRPDGSFASSYDSAGNPFVLITNGVAVAYCIEDIRLDSPQCDFDFNDIILTMQYV